MDKLIISCITTYARSCLLKCNCKVGSFNREQRLYATSISDRFPLSGVRILDLTRIVAGPYCTMILGDLGAEVLKIERPGTGDESRKWGPPFFEGTQESTYFSCVNRNKKSVCIDLKKGRQVIYDLIKECDVLVENYVPGPYASKPGYDVIAASVGGLMHITGPKDGPPCKVGVAMTDLATGLYAHGAIMAALLQRAKTNEGQWIQCDLLSTQVASLINVASNYLNAGKEATRWGSEHESIVPYESFPTKDGYLTVGTGSDAQFIALLRILELPQLADNKKFKTNTERVKNREELLHILRSEFKRKTNKEWMEVLADAPFPWGPVNSIGQVFDDPHIKNIGLVKEMEHATVGKVKLVGPPVIYSYAQNEARLPPPTLGQHTSEVLKELLKYSEATIKNLIHDKVIQ
ncbi:succinate--hydroxymethylglutarate CoA-transferase isoform X2 [Orussus abietinus]|uniref:succinate--hydroxymethylglutarate CoA-transferase isoform X2 n=1 Tax=Orussus abietinus TaxID=222816 RepID=UPI000626BAAC|nr:succinate--hydroxymethylglutarate CoA-transferase isoform X2 [Orussus abietinus]